MMIITLGEVTIKKLLMQKNLMAYVNVTETPN